MWPTEYSFILSSITPAVNDPEDLGSCALPTLILFSSDMGYAAYLPSSIPQPYSQFLSILTTDSLVLLGGSSGLLGLVATELLLRLGLDGLVGSLDSGNTLDSSGAEVSTVAVLGGLVGNSLEGPGEEFMVSPGSQIVVISLVLTCGCSWSRCRWC